MLFLEEEYGVLIFIAVNFCSERDPVNEITEGCFSLSIEDGLHLSVPVAGSNAFQHGLVLDETPFFVLGHDQKMVVAVSDESRKPFDLASQHPSQLRTLDEVRDTVGLRPFL